MDHNSSAFIHVWYNLPTFKVYCTGDLHVSPEHWTLFARHALQAIELLHDYMNYEIDHTFEVSIHIVQNTDYL